MVSECLLVIQEVCLCVQSVCGSEWMSSDSGNDDISVCVSV